MIRNIIIMVIATITISACSSDDTPSNTPLQLPAHQIEFSLKQKQIVQKGNQLAYNSWEMICDSNPNSDGNQIFSPLSLQMTLSLLANGAEGELLNELINLYTNGLDEEGLTNLNALNKKLLNELPLVDKSAKLHFANSIWCDRAFDFEAEYADKCSDIYNATKHKYDIGTEEARKDFNQWASDNTNGMIKEFLQAPPFGEAILANATYFKGFWQYPFNKKDTSKQDFFCQSGEVKQVEMMHFDDYVYDAKENSNMSYVVIPYLNGGFSMNILMPKEGTDFNECVHNFAENTIVWEKVGKAKISIPRFSIGATYNNLPEIVEKMGVPHLSASTKRIFKNAEFRLSQIMQSSKFVVDEEGSEAAAVTSLTSCGGVSNGSNFQININRPFFFTLTEQSTGTILFMGKVTQF
ncbi:MAG: serpin family protein [Bacteroides sp.]|nr:serpin family protein [Bacteroides sp.]